MSMNACSSSPASTSVRPASATRCSRSTDSSWRAWPKLNSRNRVPRVEGAYTPSNRIGIPPARSMSRSLMLSAPAHIPAITVSSLGAGFAAPDLIRGARDRHLSGDDLGQAGLFGQPEQRYQPRVRHEVVLVEARGAGGEPVGDSH